MSDYALLNEARPVARKPHRCIWCGQSINKGEMHLFQAIRWEGGLHNQRWHFECADAQQDDSHDTGDWEFIPHDNERPVAQPANTDSVPGSPLRSGARPDQPKLPESGGIGVSSIGLGAEGEQ